MVKSSRRTKKKNLITVTFCENYRAKLLCPLPRVMFFFFFFLQTLHMGIRPEYIHLSNDGIYIRMTNLFLSPHEGLGLHVKMQVKSGRQWFVAKLHISASALFFSKHTSCWCLSSIFGFWGLRYVNKKNCELCFWMKPNNFPVKEQSICLYVII